jgi:phospholipid/cholesterol/gamma-HCH transport system substrate-binding protein
MNKSNLSMSNLKVGLTVFIGIIIFLFFILIVGAESNLFVKTYSLKLFVEDVEGLTNGSLVSLGGLKIGFVDKMEFASNGNKNGIDITLVIRKEYQPQITDKSKATIKTIGLLGDKFVDISIGEPTDEPLSEWKYLTVNKSFNIEDLAVDLKSSLKDFSMTIKKVDGILDTINKGKGSLGKFIKSSETIDGLNKFIYSLNDVATAVKDKQGSLGRIVYDSDMSNNIYDAIKNLNIITDSLKFGKGSLGKLIAEDSLYNNINLISSKINGLLTKTQKNDNIVGGLLNDNSLYQEFSKVIDELNNLIKDIKSNPNRYINISVF